MRLSREFLLLMIWIATSAACMPESPGPTVVLVHGAWGGGWDWKGVEQALVARGAVVYRPTLSGLGERHHLASADIDLSAHIADIVSVLEWEQLHDVVLLGHSYGGMVITGVAERAPTRISRLVYFDALLPFDGECVLSAAGVSANCGTEDQADFAAVAELKDGFLVPEWLSELTEPPGDVPHPAKTFSEILSIESTPGRGKPALFIVTRIAPDEPDDFDWAAKRAREMGWPVAEVIGDHNVHRTHPRRIADLILDPPP